MSDIRSTEYKKKQPGGRYVWGVLRLEGRGQNFGTVGEGEGARRKAGRLAKRLGPIDLRCPQEENVGRFVRDECADGRGKGPSINAAVLLRGSILARSGRSTRS